MEEIVGELEVKALGKTYRVAWDNENEKALLEFNLGEWIEVGQNVKNEIIAVEFAKDYLKNQKFI